MQHTDTQHWSLMCLVQENCVLLAITISYSPRTCHLTHGRCVCGCVNLCVCVCVQADCSLLYVEVFINLFPANREAPVNPSSLKTGSTGGSNLRREPVQTEAEGLEVLFFWRCPISYKTFPSLRCILEASETRPRRGDREKSCLCFHFTVHS